MLQLNCCNWPCCNYTLCHFQCCNYNGCHFHMLSVAIAYVVCCNCLCCLLQLPLCCLLQLPMLSVAIAYVVCCNCLCCPLQLPMLSFEFKNVHTMCIPISTTTTLNPEPWTPPPLMCPAPKTKTQKGKGAVVGGVGQWGCGGCGTYLDPALVSSHGHVHHPAPACATIGKSIPIYIA